MFNSFGSREVVSWIVLCVSYVTAALIANKLAERNDETVN